MNPLRCADPQGIHSNAWLSKTPHGLLPCDIHRKTLGFSIRKPKCNSIQKDVL